jgi:hypothetical protein
MTKKEVAFFKTIAGDRDPPKKRVKELWVVLGQLVTAVKRYVTILIWGFASGQQGGPCGFPVGSEKMSSGIGLGPLHDPVQGFFHPVEIRHR